MLAAEALEQALDGAMLAVDDVNQAIDVLHKIAEQNPSHAVADFLLGVAKQLRKARGNLHQVNSILDSAVYTIQGVGPNFEIRTRKK